MSVPLRFFAAGVGGFLVGRGLAVLGVEAADVGGKRGDGGVVDGVVEIVGADLAFVGDGDFGGGVEGHLEVGVECLHRSDDEQRGLIDEVVAEHEAVEVADGGFDGGRRFAVPPGAEDEVLEVHAGQGS